MKDFQNFIVGTLFVGALYLIIKELTRRPAGPKCEKCDCLTGAEKCKNG